MNSARPRRAYNSTRRRQQQLATRGDILDAAQRLFEQQGYVETTMEHVAATAGVALKTVYSAFTTKSGLLRAVWDVLLKGDTDDAPVAARPWYQAILDETDPERQLRLVAHHSCAVKARIGNILRAIRSAATVDPDGRQLWELIQTDFYANQTAIVESLAARGGLRPGLDVATATDIMWTLNHPDVWLLLVGQRRWTAAAFEQWFADALCHHLLAPATPKRRPR